MEKQRAPELGRSPNRPRSYRSPLRAAQAQQTKDLILTAFADLVIERGVAGAAMAAVAERAGVAERTVYRHFPNAAALLDGLAAQAHDVMADHGVAGIDAERIDDAVAHAAALYEAFEDAGTAMRAAIKASLSEGYRSPGQPYRVDRIRELLRAELPQLSEAELSEALIMVRFQLGGWAWYLLTEREGLSTERAAALSARAVRAFVTSLRDEGSSVTATGSAIAGA